MATAAEAPASTTAEGTTPHTQNQAHPSIYELMSRVMRDVRNVSKNGKNQAQNYSFRGVDDFISALAQPLRDHGVVMMTEILDFQVSVRGKMNATHMRVAFHFHGPAGDKVTSTTLGEASDVADKASNKAMSAALKYALLQTFMIPVDAGSLDDGDRDHPEAQRSPADGYMERIRKPVVWNNVTALQAMHTEAKADGLLQAPVYGPDGETTLGELITTRGTALKAEIAEREARMAQEAPEAAAQVAAEHGAGAAGRDVAVEFAALKDKVNAGWSNRRSCEQNLAEARMKGLLDELVEVGEERVRVEDLLSNRIAFLKQQAAQGAGTERGAA